MHATTIGSSTFNWGSQTYVMGIINTTPDSFSGDGLLNTQQWVDHSVTQGQQFVDNGAHILDVGGESTRPGAEVVGIEEELRRVTPVIEALAQTVRVPISIDTYKAKVAQEAIAAGASIVNDVWGLRMDPNMAAVCAKNKTTIIVMHNRSEPRDVSQKTALGGRYVAPNQLNAYQKNKDVVVMPLFGSGSLGLGTAYNDLLADIKSELQLSIDLAKAAGISHEQIIIDPGIGFGKTVEQNLELLNRLDYFKVLGHPILLGPSNKSFIGYTLNLPPKDRVEGTAATIALGIERGADIIRVHQVKEMARVAKMTDAVVRQAV